MTKQAGNAFCDGACDWEVLDAEDAPEEAKKHARETGHETGWLLTTIHPTDGAVSDALYDTRAEEQAEWEDEQV